LGKLEQRTQAYGIMCTNVAFLGLFLYLRPMVKEPSRFVKRLNIFSMAEGLSIAITICGNILAFIGTFREGR